MSQEKELEIEKEEARLRQMQVLAKTDINPENYWGNNSYLLIRQKKIMRKYNKILDFVEPNKEEQAMLIEKNLRIWSRSCAFGMLGVVGVIVGKHLLRSPMFVISQSYYNFAKFFVFGALTYFTSLPARYRMADEVYAPLIRKYKQQAIDNGFVDYEIS